MGERDRRSVRAQRDPGPVQGEHIKGRGRVLTAGLDPEVFADIRNRSSQTHTSGAIEARKAQQF